MRASRARAFSRSCARRNTLAKIAAITAPALVIAADADLLAPPALMRIWAAHLPRHEWAVIHDAGHAMAGSNRARSTTRFSTFFCGGTEMGAALRAECSRLHVGNLQLSAVHNLLE